MPVVVNGGGINLWIGEFGVLFLHHMLLCVHWGGVLVAGQPYCTASCIPIVLKAQWGCQNPLCPQAPTSSTPDLALAAAPWPLTSSCCSGRTLPQQHAYHTATVYMNQKHAARQPCPPPRSGSSRTLSYYFSVCFTDLTTHVHCITAS